MITDLFFRLHKVERIGMGIQKMKDAMAAAGLREPAFASDAFFRAVFRRSSEFALKEGEKGTQKRFGEGSEKSSEKILAFLKEQNTASEREIAEALNLSSRAVEKQIAALKTAGRLKLYWPGERRTMGSGLMGRSVRPGMKSLLDYARTTR